MVVPTPARSLGPGDVIEISVYREPDLAGKYRISDDGMIDFPLIGPVKLLGQRPEQIEEEIRSRLAAGYLVEPKVTVFVKEHNSQKIHVMGQVNRPGTFNYESGMTVIQAVTNAGGFTKLASKNSVQLTRVSSGKEERFEVAVGDIGKGTARNIELQPGDIIFVPEAIFLSHGRPRETALTQQSAPTSAARSFAVDPDDLLNALWRKKWLILLSTIAVGGAVAAGTARQPKIYQAKAQILIEPVMPKVLGDGMTVDDLGERARAEREFNNTQYKTITSRKVLEDVAQRLKLVEDPAYLAEHGLTPSDDPQLLRSVVGTLSRRDCRRARRAQSGREPVGRRP